MKSIYGTKSLLKFIEIILSKLDILLTIIDIVLTLVQFQIICVINVNYIRALIDY